MYAPLSLQRSWVRRILFQVQRQKIVFADNLHFSSVAAAGCLGPADKLKGLTASSSKHPFPRCCGLGWAALRAVVPRTAPLWRRRHEAVPSFLLSGSGFQAAIYKNLAWVCWCAFGAVFFVKERSSSHTCTSFSVFLNKAVWSWQWGLKTKGSTVVYALEFFQFITFFFFFFPPACDYWLLESLEREYLFCNYFLVKTCTRKFQWNTQKAELF